MKTTAQEIMSRELLTVREGASIEDALKLLINNRITGLPVVNEANEMVGVVSEYDIMQQVSEAVETMKEVMDQPFRFTRGAHSVQTNTELKEILHHFLDLKYRRLPVLDSNQRLVGIISRRDIIKLFYYRARLT
jgi:CBS domain-containing protein